MKKFEYQIWRYFNDGNFQSSWRRGEDRFPGTGFEDSLNALGKQGWQLIFISSEKMTLMREVDS
jgi:phosphoglycolate phosphatase-like HAD superfamily hydrolase